VVVVKQAKGRSERAIYSSSEPSTSALSSSSSSLSAFLAALGLGLES
jgi:hypothetical protein